MANTESEVKDCMFCLGEYPAKDMVKEQLDLKLPFRYEPYVFYVCYECCARERDAVSKG